MGHLNLLNTAKSFFNANGSLIVAIDSDRRIRQLKGAGRPINTVQDRRALLENLRCVDKVLEFDTDQELINICSLYKPDIMVKGDDYVNKPILGEQFCGRVVFVKRNDDSTTKKIQSIIGR